MANTSKTRKGPKVMPAPRRAPNPRTPKPVTRRAQAGGDERGEEEGVDAEAAVGQGEEQAVTDAAGGTQSTGTGGPGNQPPPAS